MYKSISYIFNPPKKHLIFIGSIIASLVTLYIERLFGIDFDYHPDSRTYLAFSKNNTGNVSANLNTILFNSYYGIVSLMNGSIFFILSINIFLYSFTNLIIYNRLVKFCNKKFSLILLIVFLLNPYRLHLSVHVLKDTIILFLLILPFTKNYYFSPISILFSQRSFIYFPLYFDYKKNFYTICIIFIIIYYHFLGITAPWEWVFNNINTNFSFNQYDKVSNFTTLNPVLSALTRALVWPFLFLSGGFFALSPTPLFLPLLIGQISAQLLCLRLFHKPLISLGAYLVLAFFALIINGFTTYFRYAMPILLIVPMLMAVNEERKSK